MLVVVDVIGRETISDDELCDWIDRFGSWLAGQAGSFDPPARAATVNLKRFVRTLHLALSLARPPPRPAVRQARGRRPRHRPPVRRRADLSDSLAPSELPTLVPSAESATARPRPQRAGWSGRGVGRGRRRQPQRHRRVSGVFGASEATQTVLTMWTSQGALWATSLATEPRRRPTPCMRRLPTTMTSASRRSASSSSADGRLLVEGRRRGLDPLRPVGDGLLLGDLLGGRQARHEVGIATRR